jgi:hypothetical protein
MSNDDLMSDESAQELMDGPDSYPFVANKLHRALVKANARIRELEAALDDAKGAKKTLRR